MSKGKRGGFSVLFFSKTDTKTFKRLRLLSITKLQNLKAIHNPLPQQTYKGLVVINHKTTKFESNSQLDKHKLSEDIVVINHKTTKFESNSQLWRATPLPIQGCYQSQNYKI